MLAKPTAAGRQKATCQSTKTWKAGKAFLKGPIPIHWLATAARLPGRSLHVAIALWFSASLAKSATVPLSNADGLRFGLDRNAKYRALQWLEEAGLISVQRKLGRSPVVTLLEPIPDGDNEPE